jgi:hypothetical protein
MKARVQLTILLLVTILASGCGTKPEDVVFQSNRGKTLFLIGSRTIADHVGHTASYRLNFMRSRIQSFDGRNHPVPVLDNQKEFAKLLGSAREGGKNYHLFEASPGDYGLTIVERTQRTGNVIYNSRKSLRERGQRFFNTWSFRLEPGIVSYVGDLAIDLDRDPPLVSHEEWTDSAETAYRKFVKIQAPFRKVGLLTERFAPLGFNPRGYPRIPAGPALLSEGQRPAVSRTTKPVKKAPPLKSNEVEKPRPPLLRASPTTKKPAIATGAPKSTIKDLMRQFLAGEISQAEYDRQRRALR